MSNAAKREMSRKNLYLELLLRTQNGSAVPVHRLSTFVVTMRVMMDDDNYINLLHRPYPFALHVMERCGVRVYAQRRLHEMGWGKYISMEEAARAPQWDIRDAGIIAIIPEQVPDCPKGKASTFTLRLPITAAERSTLASGGVPRTDDQPEGEMGWLNST